MRNAHETASYLAFLVVCSLTSVKVRLATEYEDNREATDLFLIREGRRPLRIDVTTGYAGWKVMKNQEHRGGNPRSLWVWGITVPLSEVTTIVKLMDDHRRPEHWRALEDLGRRPVSLSPDELCPEHGKTCPLVSKLEDLGRRLVVQGLRKRPDWQRYFQDAEGNWIWMQ